MSRGVSYRAGVDESSSLEQQQRQQQQLQQQQQQGDTVEKSRQSHLGSGKFNFISYRHVLVVLKLHGTRR